MNTPQQPKVSTSAPRMPFNSTPRRRPSRLLARLSEAAKKAPYAYSPRSRPENFRPQTPPTPSPQQKRQYHKIFKERHSVKQPAIGEGRFNQGDYSLSIQNLSFDEKSPFRPITSDDSITSCLGLSDIRANDLAIPQKCFTGSLDEEFSGSGKFADTNTQTTPRTHHTASTVKDEEMSSCGMFNDGNAQSTPREHHTESRIMDTGMYSLGRFDDGIPSCLSSANGQVDPARLAIHEDPMNFSLRDTVTGEIRYPDQKELLELHDIFPECKSIDFQNGLIILKCKSPPKRAAYKVAGLPAIFIPPEETFTPIPGTPGNPRIRDFLSPFNPDSESEFEFLDRLLIALFEHDIKPTSASIYFDRLVIELKEQISSYELPGRLGGLSPYYCCGYRPFGTRKVSPSRMITLTDDIVDTTDYKEQGLCPGVLVCGVKEAATSGLLLHNHHSGEKRLTVPNHAFSDTNHVYHPDTHPDKRIGEITDRHDDLDIALVKLKDGIEYYNSFYFSAPMPKKLASSLQQRSHVKGRFHQPWYFIESAFSGLIPLVYAGHHSVFPDDKYPQTYHHLQFPHSYIMRSMGVNLQRLKGGICGSPVILDDYDVEEENKGSVIGFFPYTDGDSDVENVFIPALDELIEKGWDVA